jgi:hypothetical protein
MPSPAGPAPVPRWRLDHGRLRLGRRRPWLGLLRLRSGHAPVDDDEEMRLRPPPRAASGLWCVNDLGLNYSGSFFPSPSPSVFFFTNGETVAPSWHRSPRTTAGPRLLPRLLRLLPSTNSSLLLQPGGVYNGFGERNPKGRAAAHSGARWGFL